MQLTFTKMHGLGNDFMVLRWPSQQPAPDPLVLRAWSDRRTGVGFDQLLLLEEPRDGDTDAFYRVFNADGEEVEQCGNGARCLVRLLSDSGGGGEIRLASAGGPVTGVVAGDNVRIDLGAPDFEPSALPFEAPQRADRYALDVQGESVEFGAVSMGNPHVVLAVDSVDGARVGILGEGLERHRAFPRGTNVGFAERVDSGRLRLRVHERGVGETRACGTGAAAAAAVMQLWGEVGPSVVVELPGGELKVDWPGDQQPLWLTGPAETAFEGRLHI